MLHVRPYVWDLEVAQCQNLDLQVISRAPQFGQFQILIYNLNDELDFMTYRHRNLQFECTTLIYKNQFNYSVDNKRINLIRYPLYFQVLYDHNSSA